MTIEGSIWTFAGMTAAVGMGVVFVALFLLSLYMHYFKVLTSRLEGRAKQPAPAAAKRPAQPPSLKPAPAGGKDRADGGGLAAAVAVGLHLRGLRGGDPGGEVAAAIAAALAFHQGRTAQAAEAPPRPASGWKLSGRMEAMSSRSRRHERPAGR